MGLFRFLVFSVLNLHFVRHCSDKRIGKR